MKKAIGGEANNLQAALDMLQKPADVGSISPIGINDKFTPELSRDPVLRKLQQFFRIAKNEVNNPLNYLAGAGAIGKVDKVKDLASLKKLSTKDTKKFFDAIETTKTGNPLKDLEKVRPDIIKASQKSLSPIADEKGFVTLFRTYNIGKEKKILPEKGIASLTKDFGYAVNLGDRMKSVSISDQFGIPTGKFIDRDPLVARYDIPIEKIKFDYDTLLNASNKKMSNAEKNSDLVRMIKEEKEVIADLKGIKPSAVYKVPSIARGYNPIEKGYFSPAGKTELKDIKYGYEPTLVSLERFAAGKKPSQIIKEEIKEIKNKIKYQKDYTGNIVSVKNYKPPSFLKDYFSGEKKLKNIPQIKDIKLELDNLYKDYLKFSKPLKKQNPKIDSLQKQLDKLQKAEKLEFDPGSAEDIAEAAKIRQSIPYGSSDEISKELLDLQGTEKLDLDLLAKLRKELKI